MTGVLALHHTGPISPLPVEPPQLQAEFNAELYRWEQNYFLENCLIRHFGIDSDEVEEHCDRGRLAEIADYLASLPRCFVHRDFQSQNIVIKDEIACFIDFQGMRPGLAQYDSRVALYLIPTCGCREGRAEGIARSLLHLEALTDLGQEPSADFAAIYDLCAMQRLMQALGAYGFLGHVKERPHFLEHIPAALTALREVLARVPGLDGLRAHLATLVKSLTVARPFRFCGGPRAKSSTRAQDPQSALFTAPPVRVRQHAGANRASGAR